MLTRSTIDGCVSAGAETPQPPPMYPCPGGGGRGVLCVHPARMTSASSPKINASFVVFIVVIPPLFLTELFVLL